MNGLNALIARGGVDATPKFDIMGTMQNVLSMRQMQQQAQTWPEERNWLRQSREMQQAKFGMEKTKFQQEQAIQPMKDELAALDLLLKTIPATSYQGYPQVRERLLALKINPAILPDPSSFQSEADYQKYAETITTTSQQRMELKKKEMELKSSEKVAGEKLAKENLKELESFEAETGIDKKERGTLDYQKRLMQNRADKAQAGRQEEKYGEPYIDKSTGALVQKVEGTGKIVKIASPPQGFSFESDGKGGVSVVYGRGKAGESALTKPTQTKIEGKLLGGKEQLARMQEIKDKLDSKFLELGTRLKAAWTSFKAKTKQNVSAADAKELTDFVKFQRTAIENINLYIHEMTGAQMSVQEANRLKLAQPDPGEHWYSGDDYITFQAKMEDVLKTTRAAVARYEYYLTKGLSDTEIRGIINSNKAISLDTIAGRMG